MDLSNFLQGKLAIACCKRQEEHCVYDLRLAVAPSEQAHEIFAVLRLNHHHLMVESSRKTKVLPPWLAALQINPTDLIDDLLGFIEPAINQIVARIDTG